MGGVICESVPGTPEHGEISVWFDPPDEQMDGKMQDPHAAVV
jgi:hypothetical protein